MADVKIRKLPDWVVETFKARAELGGHSLEKELRNFLTEAAAQPKQERRAELAAFRRMLQRKYGRIRDSVDEIRADREARG